MIVIKIKIQDYAGNKLLYKNQANIEDIQKLAIIFSNLKAYGIDFKRILNMMEKFEEEEESWFR